ENLDKPRAIAVSDDRIFVTEKDGAIKVIQNNTLLESPLATLRGADVFDGGLLGIALHPNFSTNHYLYVFLTYAENGNLWNKILKITESENKLQNAEVILDKIPGSSFTNGGFIKFGPDEKLYIGTGTVSDASHLPQDLDSLSGKILRINDDGTFPNDNPFSNSPIYSLGHRNPQGMTWDDDGNLFVAEFGPEKNDEINLIQAGKNYGWPEQQCSGNESFVDAIICYDPSIEPGGILFYSGDSLDFESSFIMASMRAANLYQVDFEEGLSSQKSILSGIGRVRDVVQGPDGSLYVITSNTDGKGFPDSMDDKLLRILK
ncbi:MAG: PQQ-dependent sugar dehydrogenase, partial [Nitrosopumilus sp.]|nr:PQQ-dependent sugar dehydrogenase [Nitrosopumilus sp.]